MRKRCGIHNSWRGNLLLCLECKADNVADWRDKHGPRAQKNASTKRGRPLKAIDYAVYTIENLTRERRRWRAMRKRAALRIAEIEAEMFNRGGG